MVKIHPTVIFDIFRKKWLKGKQIAICVTPGLCLTSMTEDIDEVLRSKAHSAESGASKIH